MPKYAETIRIPSLEDIRAAAARIEDIVPETPLLHAWDLGSRLDQDLWLKAENLQRTGSFKVRGAANWVRSADSGDLGGGLITVSAGNHAQALAWAAQAVNVPVTVVMPEGSSPMKISATRGFGAEVIVQGTITEAVALMHRLREERGLRLVHPYDDPRIIAGQGTVGLEILRQLPDAARVLCPIGGGGLISGIAIAIKSLRPDLQVIGVEPDGAATMRRAWDANDPTASLGTIDTVAVSLAPAVVGEYTFAATRRHVDDIVTVSEASIAQATRMMLSGGRLYAETGAVVGIAALLEGAVPRVKDRPTVAVITGGNMDLEQLAELLSPSANPRC